MDELSLYRETHVPEQIQATYELEDAPASTDYEGLLAYYAMEGNASDRTGNGLDGNASGTSPAKDRNGQAERGLAIKDENGSITLPPAEVGDEWSLTTWIKPDLNWIHTHPVIPLSSDLNLGLTYLPAQSAVQLRLFDDFVEANASHGNELNASLITLADLTANEGWLRVSVTRHPTWKNSGNKTISAMVRTNLLVISSKWMVPGNWENNTGQIGDGTTMSNAMSACWLASGVAEVSSNGPFVLFIKRDGSLWGAGQNSNGNLGDGTGTHRFTPVLIRESGVVQVAGGSSASYFILSDGSLWAMGNNSFGKLGDGSTTIRHRPVRIVESGVRQVSGCQNHALFLKEDGSLWGMGQKICRATRLGGGVTEDQHRPVRIIESGVRQISAGIAYSLFVKERWFSLGNGT